MTPVFWPREDEGMMRICLFAFILLKKPLPFLLVFVAFFRRAHGAQACKMNVKLGANTGGFRGVIFFVMYKVFCYSCNFALVIFSSIISSETLVLIDLCIDRSID